LPLAERFIRRLLVRLFELKPEERTRERADDFVLEAFDVLSPENRPLSKHISNYLNLVKHALDAYFRLEDPRLADPLQTRVGLSAPLRKFSVERPQFAVGDIDRLDAHISPEGKNILTIVRYSLSGPEPSEEDQFQLQMQAWMLWSSNEWSCDEIRGRILCFGGEGAIQEVPASTFDLDAKTRVMEAMCLEMGTEPEDHSFPATVSVACRTCAFRSRCEDFADAPTHKQSLAVPVQTELTTYEVVEAAIKEVASRNSAKAAEDTLNGSGEAATKAARSSTEGVTIVRTPEEAEKVLRKLMTLREEGRYHAVDTETKDWEPGLPMYGNGKIICFSIYCGDDVDFGSGPRIWVDNMDASGNLTCVLDCFRKYLEDPGLKKVFHNYSFDRAMFHNAGITIGGFAGDTMHMGRLEHSDRAHYSLSALGSELVGIDWGKQSLTDLMKVEGAKRPEELHLSASEETRLAWIEYSTFDTVATWKLHERLSQLLSQRPWQPPDEKQPCGTLLDFYRRFWCPFGDTLARMEGRGVPLDASLIELQAREAQKDLKVAEDAFRAWVRSEYTKRYADHERCAKLMGDVDRLNLRSAVQLRQLLFGNGPDLVAGVWVGGFGLPTDQLPRTPKGAISVGSAELEVLAGKDPANGKFGTAKLLLGEDGCTGLAQRCRISAIEKSLSTFLTKLPQYVSKTSRVHSSFNVNTATGRLTSSNPNLQQLPALDKDMYHVRSAIKCSESRRLIVADYGQLDIRILAHLSKCKEMIRSLRSGVDFHSGTALNMYEHVRLAVERGEVALEKPASGESPVPLVKDHFATERRHAKAVNFGIAYGLTAMGLSGQLECPFQEAEGMINRWYQAYPEVGEWQRRSVEKAKAFKDPCVVTLRGRQRRLDDLAFYEEEIPGQWKRRSQVRHKDRMRGFAAQRQAINAPVQGGSADVVVEAMLKADQSTALRDLGYSMILQVHDELVFEGPEETAEEALHVVQELMEHPFLDGFELEVPLPVDAQIVKKWAEAKG